MRGKAKGKLCGRFSRQEGSEKKHAGVRIPYERTAALLQWRSVGEVLIPGVLKAGEIAETDGCEKAAALAAAF